MVRAFTLDPQKVDKLKTLTKLEGLRLVYEWSKTGEIDQTQFIHYISIVMDNGKI